MTLKIQYEETLEDRLKAKGHAITNHNLLCEQFLVALEQAGVKDMLDTICYEGSPAQKAAHEFDEQQANFS
jgi:transcriptional regulator of met regulon